MTSKPQTVLLAADLEPMEDADEFDSMEHESWWGETADWEHLSDQQFFLLEDGGFQDLILDVSEPHRVQLTQVLLSSPNVIANTPGRTTLVQHYITVNDLQDQYSTLYFVPTIFMK